jgi:thymidylate kinase
LTDVLTKLWRRVSRAARERLLGQSSRKRLASGGAIIALVGGDGAGKTTSVNGLHRWLSKKFAVRRFHLGKPPRSPFTLAALVALKARSVLTGRREAETWAPHLVGRAGALPFPGYVRLFRWVCAARDRHRLYVRARRFADGGGIAICDRYPVEQLLLMDGPNIARAVEPERMNRVIRMMLRAETSYYERIMEPELLFVLRVEPEVAVRRKTNESETHVRTRSRELWEQDWSGTRAHVIDAGRPAEEVVARLQSIVWAEL